MDNFMDKLAKRFNSGEIMRANAAAEAREIKRAKEQAAEYERMMQEMRRLNLKNVEVTEQVQQLIQAGIEQFEEYGNETETLKALEGQNKQICEALSIMKEELSRTISDKNEDGKQIYMEEIHKLQELISDKLAGNDVSESVKAAQTETTDSIKAAQAETTESIKAAQVETTDIIKAAQTELAEGIAAAQSEVTERVTAAQSELTDSIKAAQAETADTIKAAQAETLDNFKTIQTETTSDIRTIQEETAEQIKATSNELAQTMAKIQSETADSQKQLVEKLESVCKALENLQDKLNPDKSEEKQLLDEIKASIASMQPEITGLQDYVHRENVKVYRNVQAVILDVASQKTRVLGDRIDALEQKIGAAKSVLPVAIITMIFAIIATLVQLVALLGAF